MGGGVLAERLKQRVAKIADRAKIAGIARDPEETKVVTQDLSKIFVNGTAKID